MKKLILTVVVIFGVTLVNAQDKTAKEYKIEGAAAYKAKDYQTGFASFEKSISLYEADGKTDTTLYYNAAICALQVKEYEKSVNYFNRSIELDYKICKSNLYKAKALKKLKSYEEMEEVCTTGAAKCPKYEKRFNDLLFNYYLQTGLVPFNNAAKMQSVATPLAQSDADKYNAEMEKVKAEFKKSLPMLEKAHNMKPEDENCIRALRQVYEILEMKAKAASL